VSTSSL